MVARNQAEQPHWQTPLVTTTPQLEQELRLDFYSEQQQAGEHLTDYGAGNGVEFIPADNLELFIGVPPIRPSLQKRVQHRAQAGAIGRHSS